MKWWITIVIFGIIGILLLSGCTEATTKKGAYDSNNIYHKYKPRQIWCYIGTDDCMEILTYSQDFYTIYSYTPETNETCYVDFVGGSNYSKTRNNCKEGDHINKEGKEIIYNKKVG